MPLQYRIYRKFQSHGHHAQNLLPEQYIPRHSCEHVQYYLQTGRKHPNPMILPSMYQPSTFFFACQYFRFPSEELLPYSISQYIVMIFANINIDGIITIGTTDLFYPRQIQHLRMLAQIPDISLLPARRVQWIRSAVRHQYR